MAENGAQADTEEEALVSEANWEVSERSKRLAAAVKGAGGAAAVAKAINMPVTNIFRYMRGRDMKAEALVALARGTGVTLEWLATGTGPMTAGEPASPQETAPQRPISLWRDTNMDSLITAYSAAVQALLAAGKDETDPPSVMRLTAIMYDQLTGAADK